MAATAMIRSSAITPPTLDGAPHRRLIGGSSVVHGQDAVVTRTRWILLAAAVLLIVLGTSAAVLLSKRGEGGKTIRGSSTDEFVTTDEPGATTTAPAKPGRTPLADVEPWPTYGHDDARSHDSPYAHRPPFRTRWMVRTGYYIEFPPAVAYGRVLIPQLRGRLFSVDARSGQVKWRKFFKGSCTAASPAVGRGVWYQPFVPGPCSYGDRRKKGFVAAIRVAGGAILWRYRGPPSESSPVLRNGTLYFGSWDHRLYALDVRGPKPKLRWTFRADGELNAAPAYSSGTLYIGSVKGSLYAVDAKSGKLRWRARSFKRFLRGREEFYATPTVAYGRVYVGNTDGTVYAFGATTGRLLWARPAGSYVYTAAAVWKRKVFVGTYDGFFLALDAATGDVVWRHDTKGSVHGAPTVMDGLVYFATCGTCGHKGTRRAEKGPRATYALDARTGRQVWSFPDGHYSPVVADAARVYLVGSTRVYALEPRTKPASSASPPRKPKRPKRTSTSPSS
jgi:outer membrane protein assembly factor BamB